MSRFDIFNARQTSFHDYDSFGSDKKFEVEILQAGLEVKRKALGLYLFALNFVVYEIKGK